MRAFTIMRSDIERCPDKSLSPSHYREDGSCLHMTRLMRGYLHEITCSGPEGCGCEKVEAVAAWVR